MAQLRFKLPHNIHRTWDSEKNTYEPVDINDTTPVWWKCKNGHRFLKNIPDLLNRVCCPLCRASQFESIAHSILNNFGIDFECEHTPKWLSYKGRYDIWIVGTNLLIELDGQQHFANTLRFDNFKAHSGESLPFEAVVRLDNIKNRDALNNGYKLLRIPRHYDADPCKVEKFIKLFLTEGLIAQDIIDYYSSKSFSEYGRIARSMNEQTMRNKDTSVSIKLKSCKSESNRVDISKIQTALPKHLLYEWDFANNIIHPSSVVATTDKRKVWWVCEKEHRFYRGIGYRVKNNDVCPICKAEAEVRLVYETAAEMGLLCRTNYPVKELDNCIYGLYIEDARVLIEFDRPYHFEDTVVNDKTYYYVDKVNQANRKTQKAFDNKYKLLRLPYVFFDKPEMLKKFVQEFLQRGVVRQEILDFYKQYPDNIYVSIVEQQNKGNYEKG